MVADLRTIRAYRTVSDEAFLLAGLLPIDLITEERTKIKIRLFKDLLQEHLY